MNRADNAKQLPIIVIVTVTIIMIVNYYDVHYNYYEIKAASLFIGLSIYLNIVGIVCVTLI